MKIHECVQVDDYKEIARVIQEWQMKGWHLHTYQATSSENSVVSHFLLFEKVI